jgi:hypothetical protein
MIYVCLAIAAVALTAVLVFLRSVARRHVASLFRSTVRKLMSRGIGIEPAMREALNGFVRRAPFKLIKADELSNFIRVLQDLGSPVDVGAEILQQCESKHSIAEIRDGGKLAWLAYFTEIKLNLEELIRNAKTLHARAPRQYPNITIAVLASLSAREGWTFIEEQNDALIFDYRRERIRLPKQGSGKDAIRLILFEETTRRPLPAGPETNIEAGKAARQKRIDTFDTLFDEVFLEMSKPV